MSNAATTGSEVREVPHELAAQGVVPSPGSPAVPAPPPPVPEEFLNRDISWLAFNWRVLHEALDPRTPLLERVRFLTIYSSNLDEFFQKRVGGLKRQMAAGLFTQTPDGLGPRELMAAIRQKVLEMNQAEARCYTQHIKPALEAQGIFLLGWDELTEADKAFAADYYRKNLFPVLTPLAVDPGHPFPFISNLSVSLGVMMRLPAGAGGESSDGIEGSGLSFARVKVPPMLPNWIPLGDPAGVDGARRFVGLIDIIQHNLKDLFVGMEIVDVAPFRVTRNAEVERDEEDAEDLLELIEQELRDRRFAKVVRLEVDGRPSMPMTRFLMQELELEEGDVYEMPGELDYTGLGVIADLALPKLKYDPWTPVAPPRLADESADMFGIIRQGDVLVHHPYESFKLSVERFIRDAANDPKVIAIKQTLYRTNKGSPFIPDLVHAAESGKQVVCLVEIKARFDEEQNIRVAQQLEKAGVHVVYGVVGLKTHSKVAIVVRQEAEGMRVYAHIGTGNYNSKTAQLYTDLGLFTANPQITDDLVELFHYLTGRSQKHDFNRLLIAPINMRRRFVEMIDREIVHAQAWKQRGGAADDPARPMIVAKMNSLEDLAICRKLYEANRAGVTIKLIVRGFCCLRPGVPGLSENISVVSVIGRFLEHSRIFFFNNGGQGEYYIGSADWMYRNLYYRVECITPVLDAGLRQRLQQVLDTHLNDRRQAWDMQSDGTYVQRSTEGAPAECCLGSHRSLMDVAHKSDQLASKK